MAPLHHLNPVRVKYIANALCAHFYKPTNDINAIVDEYFAKLASLNKARTYVPNTETAHVVAPRASKGLPLDGLRILDVGCGGGILSEPLAYLGATFC